MLADVETEEFLADVSDVLSEAEHDALILYVAHNPEDGTSYQGCSVCGSCAGLQKVRTGQEDRE